MADETCGINGYLKVATLKDRYNIGERVELTDPPAPAQYSLENGIRAAESVRTKPKNYKNGQDSITGAVSYFDTESHESNQEIKLPAYDSNIEISPLERVSDAMPTVSDMRKSSGYIVQFKEPPILEKMKQLERQGLPETAIMQELVEHKKKIEEQHAEAKTDISRITSRIPEPVALAASKEKDSSSKILILAVVLLVVALLFMIYVNKKNRGFGMYLLFIAITFLILLNSHFSNNIPNNRATGYAIQSSSIDDLKAITLSEFSIAFNGIALDISEDEARAIRKLDMVKEVYPNLIVNTTLMDSVPLINADDVWRLDRDGNNCAESGKECLTGKGVKIGIIDTGVDYTHPDLGGCFGTNQGPTIVTCENSPCIASKERIGSRDNIQGTP
ncbi:protease inhibitor I9 family protein, partial [Candidatus Woesearchaeota archaeon]|nr:protease inhibitor I9 family protein [Candidatus Woesearchaeota archaeon]